MADIENLVEEIKRIAEVREYQVYPGVAFTESLYHYNFERKIGCAPRVFWDQYKKFVALADGFHMDGFYLYGIESHDNYENDVFSFNNALTEIDKESPSLLIEEIRYCIEIGSSALDTFTYDVRTGKWESRDRFQYDNLFISCNSMADFLAAVLAELRD